MLLDCHICEEILTIISSTYCGAKVFMSTYTQGGVIMWRSSAYSAATVCGLKRQLRASVEHAHSEVASIRKLNAANTRSLVCHQFAAREHADRLLKRPVGRPASKVRWCRAHRSDHAATPRRAVAKVRCGPVELYPHVDFIVAHAIWPPEPVIGLSHQRRRSISVGRIQECGEYVK